MQPFLANAFDYEFYHIKPAINLNYYLDYATTYAKLLAKLARNCYEGIIVWNYYYVPLIAKRGERRIVDVTDITRPITHNRLVKGLTVDVVEDHYLQAMDLIIVQVVEKLEEYSKKYPGTLIRYVPNGVDVDRFRPDPGVRREFDSCFLGKIEEQYHVAELIEAIAGSGTSSLFIGGGRDLEGYREIARRRGADITFQGLVPHEDVPGLLNKCRFGLQPAKHGGPLKLFEYLACGLPVISRQPGDESIREGIFLATDGTAEQYAERLTELANIPDEEYDVLSEKCRQESMEFSLDAMGRRYCEAISEAMS
jgi:glycosyltransferase involved in cell wall biosynthesis